MTRTSCLVSPKLLPRLSKEVNHSYVTGLVCELEGNIRCLPTGTQSVFSLGPFLSFQDRKR